MRLDATPALFPYSLAALLGSWLTRRPRRSQAEQADASMDFLSEHMLRDIGFRREVLGFDSGKIIRF